jgi:hypothetical protein
MQIRKAERKKAKLRLGIAGASGSGKTWSALEVATGMGGKIGLIDTEAGRAELYAKNFEFDVIRLEAPYTVNRYIEAIKAFEKAGYDTLIIDSLSHAWDAAGGVLSMVDAGGGWFAKGGQVGTAQQNALIETIITSKMHIITTLRAKTEYSMDKDDKGKTVIQKMGLKPVQRDNIEYEYTVFMSMNQDHVAHITKDNTQLFDQQFIKPTREMGVKLMEWLNIGVDEPVKAAFPLDDHLEEINEFDNLKELTDYFIAVQRDSAKDYPEEIERLREACTKKRAALQASNITKHVASTANLGAVQ